MPFFSPLLNHAALGIYGAVWRAATPLLRRHKRLGEGFDQRLVPDGWPCFDERTPDCPPEDTPSDKNLPSPPLCVWIQAASGGEAWLVHSLVRELLRQREVLRKGEPSHVTEEQPITLLCTTCTRQGLDVLEKLGESLTAEPAGRNCTLLPRYLPLDTPALMEKAMQQAAPAALVLLETELWPGLLAAARKYSVPVLVLNARMTEKSLAGYKLIRPFWQAHKPERVLAIAEKDAARFAALFGPEQVAVMPNIKFDRVAEAAAMGNTSAAPRPDPVAIRQGAGFEASALLTALASVREEEEDLLLPGIQELYEKKSIGEQSIAIAIAPRHMHRVAAWQKKLAAAGIPCILRSEQQLQTEQPISVSMDTANAPASAVMQKITGSGIAAAPAPPPVYLWDTFGELQKLYAIADAVFVGGSLAPLGGQNFLEPLAEGVNVCVGEYTKNFDWAGKMDLQSAVEDPALFLRESLFSPRRVARVHGPDALAGALLDILFSRQRDMLELSSFASGGQSGSPQNSCRTDWHAARAAVAAKTRASFAEWLAPRTGGTAQAAKALVEVLAEKACREIR